MNMKLTILLLLTSLTSTNAFSAVDQNIPKPGMYKWTLESVSKKRNFGGRANSDKNAQVEKNSKDHTIPDQCINFEQSGIIIPGHPDCKTGPAVKSASSTKMSAECSAQVITVELKYLSENTYQQTVHIEEKQDQDYPTSETEINSKAKKREAEIQKMYEAEKDETKKARLKASLAMMKTAHDTNAIIKVRDMVYSLSRVSDCK
jgi:hypothetical protein